MRTSMTERDDRFYECHMRCDRTEIETETQRKKEMEGKGEIERERDKRHQQGSRRNGAPGTRCHPIIAFALPFHTTKWRKRVPRFSCGRLTNPGDISCRWDRVVPSCTPTRAGTIRQRRHNYPYCAISHLYIAYQVPVNEERFFTAQRDSWDSK